MVSVSVRYLFYQPIDVKIRTWTFRFPAGENPNIIGEGIVRFANRVAIWRQSEVSTNQIALFPFVCCFCFVPALSFQGHTKIALSCWKATKTCFRINWIANITTVFRHWNCFLSCVATDGVDRHGLKLEGTGPIFSRFNAIPAKITKNIIVASTSW